MDAEAVRERAGSLPRDAGVYQFHGDDAVLYVGKAVDLRDRVRSYADPRGERIRRMVERADRIEVAVTDTETQALLLEANLIKRHAPRYNVRLKDDKSYPLVQLTDHPAPRVEITRDPAEGATVFGPFTDKSRLETVVKAIREVRGLRGCSDHKYRGRDRPCLDYEMGLCSAPCTGEIGAETYRSDAEAAVRFFEGETGVLAGPLEREMDAAAQDREFERAANLRDRLEAVRAFHGEGEEAVAGRDERRIDVLGTAIEGDAATVARLHSDRGQLVERTRHRLDAPEAAGAAAVLAAFLAQFYAERELPDAVLLPERPADSGVADWLEGEGVAVRVPGAGREATLVDLALKNARSRPAATDELGALAAAVSLPAVDRIEGMDVSHAGGRAAVGSDVCFVGGDAETADYRRKKLTDRNDDPANVRDLVRWRADRAVAGRDDRPDPDLLVIDGGEAQLRAALAALDAAGWAVPAVALAKAEERVLAPASWEGADGESAIESHDWDSDDPALHVLQRVRDEAHRFAVQYHQTLRDEVHTPLDDVPGVGPERRRRLLRRFGSVDGVRAASAGDLADVPGIGEETARTLVERL